MKHSSRSLLLGFVLLAVWSPSDARSATDPSGHWEGAIQLPGSDVGIEIDLVSRGTEPLSGTIDIPSQGIKAFPLSRFVTEGTSLTFQVNGAPGERVFHGALSSDGTSMSGEFTQGGYTFPFSLTRTGNPRVAVLPRNSSISKALEGTWNGVVEVNGVSARVVLTLSNLPDGTATGSVFNDRDRLDIPISRITQDASRVTLDLRTIGAVYSGSLNGDGTEVVGTYTLGPTVLPITFRRADARSEN